MPVDNIEINELNRDQLRERVNTAQRYQAWRDARERLSGFRGSLVWHRSGDGDYLLRSYYDSAGIRRQKTEGIRAPETERLKAQWDAQRDEATAREKALREVLARQASVNRALQLGRVPLLGARIIRAIDAAGLLGRGLRIVGTNAIYAYEAAAGVTVDASITTTEDMDLLMDARRSLRLAAAADIKDGTLISLLRKIDRSFERTRQNFRAANRDGYLVDLIPPAVDPPWRRGDVRIGASEEELTAIPIDGLAWLESAPAFEAVAIDEKGAPVRIVATDPRVFAAHKLWLSRQPGRDPLKRRRDEAQAKAVGRIVTRELAHLPYEADDLRMLPRAVFEAARPLFDATDAGLL
ncbi:nucleotidyltransferase domain-containing protein [Xanthobacter autotrophicus]|uniref:nucleotidyltransferase domain-containing protein n=1 Tax=Xanthobacter TaxID=279 RepID=UPI0024AA6345|nr:nucleotidyltransferase domain-containing protein [Xanthobacter autotrophicus]MDI4663792.1 nucleotidyltransferase domain-containing protein [Xanthobacter autotrophicus]